MCELTTEWILESAQSFRLCTIYIFGNVLWLWGGELLIPRSEKELRRSEGEQAMLIDDPMVRGAMLARPTRRATLSQSSGGRKKFRRSEGSACS